MKPELNQTQAIYPPEGPKPKVCVTTTNHDGGDDDDNLYYWKLKKVTAAPINHFTVLYSVTRHSYLNVSRGSNCPSGNESNGYPLL